MYDSAFDNKIHIGEVRKNILSIVQKLSERAIWHDRTKFVEPEKSMYDTYVPKLKEHKYGSREYEQDLKEMSFALQHHFEHNRHHPEHFENGVTGMNLVDLTEMLADWAASSKRSDTSLSEGMEINKKRFGISDQLFEILQNTVEDMGW